MERLLEWLSEEAKGFRVVKLIGFTVALSFLYGVCMALLASQFDILPKRSPIGISMLTPEFPIVLLLMVALEEMFFRFIPLAAAVLSWGVSKKVLVVGILSSILFGWLHGSFVHIFIQGIGGILLCALFLKCGGFQRKNLKALFVTTSAHTVYNSILILIAIAGGATKL